MDDPGFIKLAEARVAIVGLGLMGGSLALALAGRCREIIGADAAPAPLASAFERGIIHRTADFASALETSDLLILATPVQTILALLDQMTSGERRPGLVILDLGSTKSAILASMKNLPAQFDPVGGHPMCGKEISGLGNADPDLYRGKTFVLCPLERTSGQALALAHELVSAVGAQAIVLDAETHDACAALVSHLPYTVATALMRTALANTTDENWRTAIWHMAASGFRDTTRLAASDLTMMVDIFLTNRAAILEALAQYKIELDSLTAAIAAGDADRLRGELESAQRQRGEMFK